MCNGTMVCDDDDDVPLCVCICARACVRALCVCFRCTKLYHHKAVELKDDVCEKQSAVTINPRHMRKAFRIMNELRRCV